MKLKATRSRGSPLKEVKMGNLDFFGVTYAKVLTFPEIMAK